MKMLCNAIEPKTHKEKKKQNCDRRRGNGGEKDSRMELMMLK